MKKALAVIMALMMCFAMTACSSDDGGDEEHYKVQDIEIGTPFGEFVSTDLEGNEVTQEIFGEKDVTIVNVWATYCLPCIAEMSQLEALKQRLPDNAQIIGIVRDSDEGEDIIEDAHTVVDGTTTFTHILMSDSLKEALSDVEAVPTTFIVDKEGKIVCTPIVGAYVDTYEEEVNKYLDTLN